MKGVYKPMPEDIFIPKLARVVRTVEYTRVDGKRKKQTVYTALADDDRVLGRISGAKSPKHASEIADRLYGEKDKPQAPVVVQGHVFDVRRVKEGGEKKVRNRKSMKGYLLVQCKQSDHIFSAMKEIKGVYAVLPFTEKITIEEIEKYGLPDYPSSLTWEEQQKFTVDPKQKPMLQTYNVGDEIDIVAGPFSGQRSKVERVLPEDRVTCYAEMLGKKISVAVHFAEIRKA
jgi:transcription antitermination factor NusG